MNGISICSAVFVELMVVTNTQTDIYTERSRHAVCIAIDRIRYGDAASAKLCDFVSRF